jgi:hypothetical protein
MDRDGWRFDDLMSTVNHDHRQPWPPSTMTTANHDHCQPWPLPTMTTANHEYHQPWAPSTMSNMSTMSSAWAVHEQCMNLRVEPTRCLHLNPLLNTWGSTFEQCMSNECMIMIMMFMMFIALMFMTLEHLMNKDRVDHPDWPTGRIWLDHAMRVKANGDYDSYDSWWLWWLDACLGQMTVVAMVFDVRHILSLADHILYSEWCLIPYISLVLILLQVKYIIICFLIEQGRLHISV